MYIQSLSMSLCIVVFLSLLMRALYILFACGDYFVRGGVRQEIGVVYAEVDTWPSGLRSPPRVSRGPNVDKSKYSSQRIN